MVGQTLQIFALGPPVVRLGGSRLTFPTRKTLALLVYLALEKGLQPREHLAALLWPEASPERSLASLRHTLGHLQKALRQANQQTQTPYLSVTHNSLGLNPDVDIDFDLHRVEQAYALARAERSSRTLPMSSASLPALQQAAASQHGEFMAGFSLGNAPSFDDWAATQREAWCRRLSLILDRLSEIQFASGDFASAAETAAKWIGLDGLNEVAYRRKMRAHFSAGERGHALETYDACRDLLAAELVVEPEPETAALAEQIRTKAPPVHHHIPHTAQPQRRPVTAVTFLGNLFIGRSNEYQALVDSYGRAAAGQPQLVVVQGEAGIGKTRLARKFLEWAAGQGSELLSGSAFESGIHLPFQPLVDALRLRFEQENSPEDLLGEMWWLPLVQLLPELRQLKPDAARAAKEPGAHIERLAPEGEVLQSQLFEAIVQLTLVFAKRTPLVLFFDDLQWTDRATLDLLQYAIRRWQDRAARSTGARVLLLVSLRSEVLHPMSQPQSSSGKSSLLQWLTRVGRELAPVHIELEPLGEPETMQLIQSILAPPAGDFAEWLYTETLGQPFYLIETLKDLLERRVLHPNRRAEGQWTFAVDAEHDLGQAVRAPSTVYAVVRSRLNRLSPYASSLLASGAVLEQRITFERMCFVSNVNEDLALPALDELISSRLLVEAAQPGAPSAYRFTNDMLRNVVYGEAGDARRRLFHRRALEILTATGDAAAVLAHHALAGGLALEAFQHSLAAGREALRILAVNEAIVHFEHAQQVVREAQPSEMPDQEDMQDLFLLLDQAYRLTDQTIKVLALDADRDRYLLD